MDITEQEILRRRDMRDILTFTIDPADAKDFDDALSFADPEDGTWQVGVHIADVSHYVRPGDPIDEEAYRKGTSVYLVDRVIPMLPEELCNDLCSLRPNEDKLCMSVVFTVTHDGRILKYKICRTVIHSDARLTYEQAQDILEHKAGNEEPSTGSPEGQLGRALRELNLLAKIFRQKRMADGAMDMEQDEVRFRLDEQGHPVEIYYKTATDATRMIEEWMLMANKTVATHLNSKPMVYRVHDLPDADKLKQLRKFERRMGDRVDHSVIDLLTIRAMAKAEYSTHNIGHYGLRFRYYTHFTSPIRRYPDLMVHRLVEKYVLTGKGESLPVEVLEEMCKHCSEREIDAQQQERDSIKQMQAIWISDHLGEEMEGRISSVTEYGLFVTLTASRCDGLVHISTIAPDDYVVYDEKNFRLIAERSGQTYTLGDEVRVRVTRVDIDKRQIDYRLV